MRSETFENVRGQIGYCGIWCGSCAGGNGTVAELARRLEQMIQGYSLEKWLPKQFDFGEFTKGLQCIQTNVVCRGCRNGGGPSNCKIRICGLQKGVSDCSLCDELTKCSNFDLIEKNHPKIKEDLLETRNANHEELFQKWLHELRTKWPHCILFCSSTEK